MKDPFEQLGLKDTVTQNELYDRYKELRAEYQDKRFAPGAAGTDACEKLDEIEQAYKEADQILKERFYITNYATAFKTVEDDIKNGKLDDAQSELDKMIKRDAEWHFYESMIFYKKGWINDSQEQLKAAIELEPTAVKYQDALKNLESKASGNDKKTNENPKGFYDSDNGGRTYQNVDPSQNRMGVCTPCDCCNALICSDCCCECMGGDCIPCC